MTHSSHSRNTSSTASRSPRLSDQNLESYIKKLLEDYADFDEIYRLIVENADIIAHGVREGTPRSIKRCIHTVRPSLELHLTAPKPVDDLAGERVRRELGDQLGSKNTASDRTPDLVILETHCRRSHREQERRQ